MENIYSMPTVTLLEAINLFKTPASYLLDTFFSKKIATSNSSWVAIEYKKGKRLLAPYIVKGAKAITVDREGSFSDLYKAPMIGVKRIITAEDLEMRTFGETPVYSTMSGTDRANKIIAEDLVEMQRMIANKKNQMAAELLQTGKLLIEGFADDGRTIKSDLIDFNFTNIFTVNASWAVANTDIYKDIYDAVNKIAEDVGELPDIMVIGKNVEQYILNNRTTKDWLMIPNAQYANFANLAPKYISPQVRYVGRINALGLEIYSYLETYYSKNGIVPFIDADTAIIGIGGRGKQITGAVNLMEGGNWNSYAAEYVPHYTYSEKDNESSLALYSRFVPVPEVVDSWATLKVKP